jgi:hypothetical protein
VNYHAGYGHDPALGGNGYVNHLGFLIRKPMQLSRCLVAEAGTRAGLQDRRPQLRPPARQAREGRIDTKVDLPA